MSSRLRKAVVAVALAAAVTSCAPGCALGGTSAAATAPRSGYAYVAIAVGPKLAVHRSPARPVTTRLDNPNTFHDPLVLLATARSGDWLKVLLPIRPNGSSGWVQVSDVQLTWTPW